MQYGSRNNNNEIIINSSTLIYNEIVTDLNKSFSYSGGEKVQRKKKEKSFIFKKLCKLGFGKKQYQIERKIKVDFSNLE